MKTTHALIIGCAIVLGFGLHAFMNRYEHKSFMREQFPMFSSKLNKITGEMSYYAVAPPHRMGEIDQIKSFIYQIDAGEFTED